MNGKIFLRRDRIQFETLDYPQDGNSYTNQAAHAWECAAIGVIEGAGYQADVDAGHGRDHTNFRLWVEPTDEIESDDGYEPVELTVDELVRARKFAYLADEAGRAAAHKFAAEQAVHANPD